MTTNPGNGLKLRIATYNIGDFSGDGFAPGSPEGIRAIREAEALPPLRLTLSPDRLFHRRFSDMNHYD